MIGGERALAPFLRFLVSGVANTIATWLLYLLLIQIVPYRVGYTVAFVSGIVLAYALSRYFVFQRKGSAATVAAFPLIYLFQYVLGLAVISVWVEGFGWPAAFAPLAAVALTVPVTFLLSRRAFSGRD